MGFLKKRSTAIVIFVIVVVLFTLLGSHRSLERACRKAEDAFFDPSLLQAEGYYTCPGDQLEYCVDYANRLLSTISSDGEWADTYQSLRDARSDLIDALASRDISAIGKADQALAEAVLAVETMAEGGAYMPPSHDDYEEVLSLFHSAQAVLDDPAYNEHILAFREQVLGAFPANILRHLTFVDAPETFP